MSGSQTVYVHRLTEKMNLEKLKVTLYHAFSAFGNVIEIHASKRNKLRGQAWIVFEDAAGAAKAVSGMNGQSFGGKIIEVTFSNSKSDVVAKADGTYRGKATAGKRKRPEGSEEGKAGMEDDDGKKMKSEDEDAEPSSKRVALSSDDKRANGSATKQEAA